MPATGSTAKPEAELAAALAGLDRDIRYRVAFSGGRDSSVLLHALASLRPELNIHAVHVNHRIHPDSTAWARHCAAVCADLGVACSVRCVSEPVPVANLEAWARAQRYRLLGDDLAADQALLTAHHRRDQVETVLLNLLRGSGADGLAAMPRQRPLAAGRLVRPLLDVDPATISDYAQRHALDVIEDPANADPRHDRNYLRADILPRLEARFAGALTNIARSADLIAASHGGPRVEASTLELNMLRAQSPADRNRLLRAWLRAQGFPPPRHRMLDELWPQLLASAADATPLVRWPGVELRRYRERLYAMAPLHAPEAIDWEVPARGARDWPWGGRLAWRVDEAGGRLRITTPRGGERLRVGGMRRRLKALFQQAGVPPWQRSRLPLLWSGDVLLAVGDRWRSDEVAPFEWLWGPSETD